MDAKDSREQAKRCLEFASTVKNACIKALLFDIARAWLSLSYALGSLIDCFMEQLDQVFRLRFLHVDTRC